MYVCACTASTDEDIERAIDAGATTVEDVAGHCGAGSDCGSCHPLIDELLDEVHVSVRRRHVCAA